MFSGISFGVIILLMTSSMIFLVRELMRQKARVKLKTGKMGRNVRDFINNCVLISIMFVFNVFPRYLILLVAAVFPSNLNIYLFVLIHFLAQFIVTFNFIPVMARNKLYRREIMSLFIPIFNRLKSVK